MKGLVTTLATTLARSSCMHSMLKLRKGRVSPPTKLFFSFLQQMLYQRTGHTQNTSCVSKAEALCKQWGEERTEWLMSTRWQSN
eukprot:1158354-Pelagomonas_calceolata.AAC.5